MIFAALAAGDSSTTVSSTVHLLEPLTRQIFAITGNFPQSIVTADKIQIINVKSTTNLEQSMLIRIPGFILLQLRMSYNLLKIGGKIDVVFLAAGASTLVLPALLAKLMRKKIISLRPGTDALQRTTEVTYRESLLGIGKRIILPIVGVLERLNTANEAFRRGLSNIEDGIDSNSEAL